MSEAPKAPYCWTKTKPDRPGWWWCKGDWAFPIRIVAYGNRLGECMAGKDSDGWLWSSSPIPEPSEPPEHPLVQELRKHAGRLLAPIYGMPGTSNELSTLADKIKAALESK